MRVLGWVLAGALALTAPTAVHAGSLGPGSYSMPNGWDGDWRRASAPSRQWNGGPVSRQWGPNGPPGGWCPCVVQGVPTYWVWGPSGGAFDYPFADWRGPTGGWGNP
jgi:hypothetical protein